MSLRQIDDVDVVAHTRAVRRVVIIAEHGQVIELSSGDLGDVGHQVVRNAVGIFAHASGFVRADGVKVAQQHHRPFRISGYNALQDFLNHVLRPAVGVRAALAEHILPQRHFVRHAVDRRRGREHNALAAVAAHGFAQRQGGVKIVAVVFQRLVDGFAHGLEPREMNHGIKAVLTENLVHCGAIAYIGFVRLHRAARDFLHAAQRFGLRIYIIINNDHIMSRRHQFHTGVRRDKSGTAGQQNLHGNRSPLSF